eukprot:gene27325-36081_t
MEARFINILINALHSIKKRKRRGFGLLAVEHIQKGDLLIREKPLLVIHTKQSWFQPSDSYSAARISREFAALNEGEKLSYQALSQYPQKLVAKCGAAVSAEDLLAIFRSNAYPFNSTCAAVYPIISRINSECKPNVHYHCDSKMFGVVHAIRDIKPGEEITNCYIGQLLPRSARQEYLQRHFGFRCDCIVCSKTGAALDVDDHLRVSIAKDLESIRTAASNSGEDIDVSTSFQLFRGMMERLDRQQVRLAELGISDDPVLQLQLHDLALRVIQSFLPKLKLLESAIPPLAGDHEDDVNMILRMVHEEERKRTLAARNAAIICKGSFLEY